MDLNTETGGVRREEKKKNKLKFVAMEIRLTFRGSHMCVSGPKQEANTPTALKGPLFWKGLALPVQKNSLNNCVCPSLSGH